ncbi:hypothetical protein pdam_00020330 [Pocillopora damicornis]|uniref:Uncharacterized protein n=1 Tax=Pocillopora damicornis TaxID=46731 RepID=A0A3M6T7H2_POCDA|nr:hypothetical protein pdam_00020330 [Pocillopora damicornis]
MGERLPELVSSLNSQVTSCDPGHEFTGEVTTEIAKHGGIIEQLNHTSGEHLFTFQYSPEMNFTSEKRSIKWVKRLLEVVSPLNSQATRLTEKKPLNTIKEKVFAKEAGESDDIAKLWLMKQTILQINLPAPKHMP